MKKLIAPLFVAAVIGTSVFTIGCSHEVSHSEADSPTLTGGNKHQESTTYKNPDGSYTTERTSQKTNP